MCLVAWPQGIQARSEVRHQYIHAIDVVPTIYDLLGIEPPSVLKGYTQSPIEGESFKPSAGDPSAPEKETQFYSMLGQRAIYHQGWLANTMHPPISGWGNFAHDVWEVGQPSGGPSANEQYRRAVTPTNWNSSRDYGTTSPASTTHCHSTIVRRSKL